jgi:hypothetical protein
MGKAVGPEFLELGSTGRIDQTRESVGINYLAELFLCSGSSARKAFVVELDPAACLAQIGYLGVGWRF